MPVTSICDFENHNGLSVNVYEYEDGDVFPVCVTQNYRQDRHVNLLLLCASYVHKRLCRQEETEPVKCVMPESH